MFFLPSNVSLKQYILIIAVVLPFGAQATETLSLKKMVDATLGHNRQLQALSKDVEQAHAQIQVMHGRMMPRIDASTAWVYTNDPLQVFGNTLQQQAITVADFVPNRLNYPNAQQSYQTRLGLRMPLFAGGGLQAGQQQAEHHAQAAELDLAFQKQKTIYQVIVLYMQALQYKQELVYNKRSVQAAKQRWQDAQSLQAKGLALLSDVMQARVYMLHRQDIADAAESAYQQKLEQLSLLMGSRLRPEAIQLQTPSLKMSSDSLPKLLLKASEHRLDLQAMKLRLQALSAQREMRYASDMPHVDLRASQAWNSATPALKHGHATVAVTVRMNLFKGGSDHAEQRRVESAYEALQWRLKDHQQLLENQVRQAWRGLQIATSKLQRQQEAIKQSQESLRILLLRYQQGIAKTATILDAQVAVDRSNVALVHAQSDLLIAQSALMLAAGLLNDEVIL